MAEIISWSKLVSFQQSQESKDRHFSQLRIFPNNIYIGMAMEENTWIYARRA